MIIQRMLAENGGRDFGVEVAEINATGAEASADWIDLRSRETYLGIGRTENVVMGRHAKKTTVAFRVFIDGQIPDEAHGIDVDGQGINAANEPWLYQWIPQPKPIVDRHFEIEFLDPAVRVYLFT